MTTTSTASSIATSAASSPDTRPTRRTVTRAVAWTVPVVAASAAAPAYAASLCTERSAAVSTSMALSGSATVQGWARTSETSGSWRTVDPDGAATKYSNARIAVTCLKRGQLEYGFATAANNLTAYTTGGVTGLTINQRPSAGASARGYAQRTETNFNFQRPVYNLTFTIADISKQGSATGTNGFWDALWVESDALFTVTARDTDVVGAGTSSSDPFTVRNAALDVGDTAPNNVTLRFAARCTYVKIYYWSATKAQTTYGGQGITVGNMSMQLAPNGCV